MRQHIFQLIVLIFLVLSGCSTQRQGVFENDQSQLKLRTMQTRSYETTDKKEVMRAAISTLQDLGFVIDQADYEIGTLKATKLSGYNLTMSLLVRPRNTKEMMVRASARYNDAVVDTPKTYQDFFSSLSKGLFLEANLVE